MNLREHYRLYIAQVNSTLKQFIWEHDEHDFFGVSSDDLSSWVKKDPSAAATYNNALEATADIKAAITETGDEYRYKKVIKDHQENMSHLFDRYILYYMKPWRDEYKDTRGPVCGTTVDEDFIAEKGWDWFKFFDKSVTAKLTLGSKVVDLKVIPRYTERFCRDLEGTLYLDADEMLLAKKLPGNSFDDVMKYKERAVPYKFFLTGKGEITAKAIKNFNGPSTVRDWTLDLFPH